MTHQVLTNCLRPIIQAETRWRKRRLVTISLLVGAIAMLAMVIISRSTGWWSSPLAFFVVLGSLLAILLGWFYINRNQTDVKSMAREVEDKHPELNSMLLTAIDMDVKPGGRLGYLQSQILSQVTEHAIKNRWVRQVSTKKLARAGWYQLGSLAAFFIGLWFLLGQVPRLSDVDVSIAESEEKAAKPKNVEVEISVEPGDVEVEKGSRVVVEATFSGRTPAGALIVLTDPADGSIRGRLPMRAGLDDSVFSAIVAKVDSDTKYEVRFEESSSDQFTIETYEHPKLEQADATIISPEYSGKPVQTIEDTRKISLLEGSKVEWSMKVSKPLAAAELFGKDETIIKLKPSKEDPTILVASHMPEKTQKYRLHLVDKKDRANKRPPWLTVTVKKNLPPKLEFAFPKRDVNVSLVEELSVEARVWDDLGVKAAGIVFAHGGNEKEVALAEGGLPGEKKHQLGTMLAVEELGAKPRDLISYHLWAEDLDKEGKVRRTQSDMFLAEVRHFEDFFREQQASSGSGEQPESTKLLKLQKDILNASWKVLREANLGKNYNDLNESIEVVRESQIIAIQKTVEAIEKTEDPEVKSYFEEAKTHMESAVEHFTVSNDPFKDPKKVEAPIDELEIAYASVRSAYESLIKARAREHTIMQSQEPSKGQPQEKEQQLMNLELKQKDLRYKENSTANPEETAEQKENIEVLNKLKELARRQEAIAKKIKELQNQLEEAKSKEEKQEIEKQLKRLKEEQDDLLRELDDLSERMDSEENRANMAEERAKLEETRENVRETAKKLEEQNLADAANSATRAQRELEEVEDEFRKRTSRQFAEEMRGIRSAARELAEKQQQISQKLDEKAPEATNNGNYFRKPKENLELAQELEAQAEQLENLVDSIKEMSEQSEEAEPLLSDALYDAVRIATVNGVEESLNEATRMIRYNRRNAAREPEQNAAQGIEDLKNQVEKAAEKILGSEADALRLARNELDRLIEQSRSEVERMNGEQSGDQPKPGNGQQPGEDGETPRGQGEKGKAAGGQPGDGKDGGKGEEKGQSGKGKGSEPGKGEGKGETPGNGQPKGGKGQPTQMAGSEPGKGKGQGKGSEKGKGEGEGKGEGKGKSEMAESGKGKGKGEGKGQGKGKGQSPGEGDAQQMAEGAKGSGKGKGSKGGKGQGSEVSNSRERGRSLLSQGSPQRRGTGSNFGGDDHGGQSMPSGLSEGLPMFFDQPGQKSQEPTGPITGEEYKDFANTLGNIEEMMPEEDLRNDVAKVLDNARGMRIDFKRDNMPPAAAQIEMRIVMPLVELRSRVSEELAKLNRENPLAPIDRDPVPGEYRELVRKYYQELGAGN